MATSAHIQWLTGADALRLAPARGRFACALVCDVRDPTLEPLTRAAPGASDLADEKAPSASERTFFHARRAALRSLVGALLGVEPAIVRIGYDSDGAPRLQDLPAFVSVSSRGSLAALAIASSPIGVDLEPFDGAVEPVDAVLHPRERAMLAALEGAARTRAFLRVWTAKEAYLKALGRGFKRDPALIAAAWRGTSFTIEDTGFRAPLTAASFAPALVVGDIVAACVAL